MVKLFRLLKKVNANVIFEKDLVETLPSENGPIIPLIGFGYPVPDEQLEVFCQKNHTPK